MYQNVGVTVMIMVFNATFKQRLILHNGSHVLQTHAQCTKAYNNSACVRWMCNYKIKKKIPHCPKFPKIQQNNRRKRKKHCP